MLPKKEPKKFLLLVLKNFMAKHASTTTIEKEKQIAIDTVWFLINQMKFEKQKIIDNFEKENMSFDQYADHMKTVGLNDVV